ncbi:MAG TPA: cytochrome c [Terriglobales bacterium]|jgi:mono/diheme cytochrome c family protein|nr:cytochrome c [Terriglobales bacterium]
MESFSRFSNQQATIKNQPSSVRGLAIFLLLLLLAACTAERRKTDAELGLTPQQSAGRKVYDAYCDRCHEPYSSRGKQGPSLKGIFRRSFLPLSGLPANDDRVAEIIRFGRSKMPGYGQVLSQQQVEDLLAYLHTL